jgi:tetratricopeptide (TPR) repeat protein
MAPTEQVLSPSFRSLRYEAERARELLAAGECSEARGLLEELLARARAQGVESARLRTWLGQACAVCGDLEAAVNHLLAAVAQDPFCEESRGALDRVVLRVRLALLDARCPTPATLYGLLLRAHAADDQAHAAMVRHLVRAGRTAEALELAQQVAIMEQGRGATLQA